MEQTLPLLFFPDPDSDLLFIPEDVRLVDGPGHCQGRVEVLHQSQWSTVCKAGWNLQVSKVVCRQLGCGRALLTYGSCNKNTQGKGPIWMGKMSCSGQEANLRSCLLSRLENNCTHGEDTWMECEGNGRWPCIIYQVYSQVRLNGNPGKPYLRRTTHALKGHCRVIYLYWLPIILRITPFAEGNT
jgi:hypothetical protein